MMKECLFCKIVSGKLPSYKVYEDALFFGFLDIVPRTHGHSLLVPKKHCRWVYDVEEFDKYWLAAHALTRTLQGALSPVFVSYVTHGLEVPHAHIHILPRQKDENVFVPQPIPSSPEELEHIASKIRGQNK